MESLKRSLVKTISYRLIGAAITGSITWFLTGQLLIGIQVGILDSASKFVFYFIHERAWNKISFGRIKPPEYEI